MLRYSCILVFEISVRGKKNIGLYHLEPSFIYSVGCSEAERLTDHLNPFGGKWKYF